MKVQPYFNFDGKAQEAFEFYQDIFGGEPFKMSMGEAPGSENMTEEEKARMMHISLRISDDFLLMASDIVPSMGHELRIGNQTYVSIFPDSRKEADRIFEKLSQGAAIEMPLADQFWGDYYGSLTDRYGIKWMVNYEGAPANARP